MKNIGIQMDWEQTGASLARLSSNEQNSFFRGFANEMNSYDTNFEKERQLIAIVQGTAKGETPFTDYQRKDIK